MKLGDRGTGGRSEAPAVRRALTAGLVGLLVGIAAAFLVAWQPAILIGWDGAAALFLVGVLSSIAGKTAESTAGHATREDSSRAVADLMLLGASGASLGAVALTLLKASGEHGIHKALLTGLAFLSIILSWAVVHLVFTLKYARLYYGDTPGGIDFHDRTTQHTYLDFAYMAFTIGMTYQVSDTDITERPIRATALRHALLSFVFGTAIIATTINLIAGLAH